MKYLILLVGIYLIYRYQVQAKRRVNAGRERAPIDDQPKRGQTQDDEADYIDYEEVE